ncbi:hypothetical protein DFH27DRAFT_606391 [Peziza echinospora]|nr:hypothetical protein DFH27DRAFT_606391 [Peziza echinospora]
MAFSVLLLPLLALLAPVGAIALPHSSIVARDSPDGRCGTINGLSCASSTTNICCSQAGWCGDTSDHCGSGCQSGFGACTGSTETPGSGRGAVPYGVRIDSCTVPGTIALTYDDGPYTWTSQLVDILDSYGVKATFFVTGNNLGKGAIDDPSTPWADVIRRTYQSGHQIASHTWDHSDLDAISEADRRFQMSRLESAFSTILGQVPTYMRPPYIRCGDACQATMRDLGYHVIIWDLDTDDYNNVTPALIGNSKNRVSGAISGANARTQSFLSIAHDIHYETVFTLTKHEIEVGLANGFRFVTLGECLGDPAANWYR